MEPSTTIVREPLCTVPYCPAPADPDAHVCPHCLGTTIEHQHIDPRGMGGSPSRKWDPANIVMICPALHKQITNHELSVGILDILGWRVYRVWNRKNETICEFSPWWMQGDDHAPTQDHFDGAQGEAGAGEADGLREEAGAAEDDGRGDGDDLAVVPVVPSLLTRTGLAPLPDNLPYEEWRAIGSTLGGIYQAAKWALGDWINFGEAHYGEKYADALDMTQLSEGGLRNIVSTCNAFPDELSRCRDVPFSVFMELASLARSDPEKAESLLVRAEAEKWTVETVRDALRPALQEAERERCPTCGREMPR